MDIRYKLYPHPVLTSNTDDYIKSSFQFKVDVTKGIRELKFSFSMNLDNDGMKNLIQAGLAEYLVHIECPQTCYRDAVKSDEISFRTNIPEKNLNGKVSICAFVVAKQDIEGYSNPDFNPDYDGVSFSVERGSILAIGGQYNLNVVKDTEELARIPSIFTICKYASDTDESMKIDIDSDKIAIALSDDNFQNYRVLSNMPSYLPVFHSMIIVPALIYVFETLRHEGIEDYESRRWFIAIKKAIERHDIKFSEEIFDDIPSYILAQKLLDMPIDRALCAITMSDDGEED